MFSKSCRSLSMTCRTIWKTTFTGLIEESQHKLKEIEKFYVTKVMELPTNMVSSKVYFLPIRLDYDHPCYPPPFCCQNSPDLVKCGPLESWRGAVVSGTRLLKTVACALDHSTQVSLFSPLSLAWTLGA